MQLKRKMSFSMVNLNTGYIIEVYLDSFKSMDDGAGILYRGFTDLKFVEIPTTNTELREKWLDNRDKLYAGSPIHFLRSLAEGKLYAQGYRVYSGQFSQANTSSYGSSYSFVGDIPLTENEYFKEDSFGRGYYLEYPGELKVEYQNRFMGSKYSYDGFQRLEYEIKHEKPY